MASRAKRARIRSRILIHRASEMVPTKAEVTTREPA